MSPSEFYSSLCTYILIHILNINGQTLRWYGLEPHANHSLVGMFPAIYEDTLYLVGGAHDSVTTLDLSDIFMNDYNALLYQPDLNVQGAEWHTEQYWFSLNYNLFCNQSCSTQIGSLLYIISPFINISNVIRTSSTMYIYDLSQYSFLPTRGGYDSQIPRDAESSCILNNDTHIFIVGGGNHSAFTTTV